MPVSANLRPLLRDVLGDEADDISDEMIQMVASATAQVRYINAVLNDDSEAMACQFYRYQMN